MKKFIAFLLAVCFLLSSCSVDKSFKVKNGEVVNASSYGWLNEDKKVEGVKYEFDKGTILWSIVFIETAIIPVFLTGYYLYYPVEYTE